MEEIWKVSYESKLPKTHKKYVKYEVSNLGRVKRNGILYECKLDRGYKVFSGCQSVHRAVAKLFVPNPSNYNEVDHINGDPLDNKAINLQWCTHKDNLNNPITRKRNSEARKGNQYAKGKPYTEERRKKQSKSMKGRIQTEETRRKRSEIMKNKYKNGYVNPMKGKTFGPQSEEHKRKRSEAMKIYWQNKRNENQIN